MFIYMLQGKLIEIHFSAAGKICGAKIQTCKKLCLFAASHFMFYISTDFFSSLILQTLMHASLTRKGTPTKVKRYLKLE